jgi:hypothetical protein
MKQLVDSNTRIKNNTLPNICSLFIAAFMVLLLPVKADEEVILEDSFSLGKADREAGFSLNFQKMEKGQGVWFAPNESLGYSAAFTADGTISIKGDQHCLASVKVDVVDKKVTLSADVRPFTSDWIALAFFPEAESMDWFESKSGKDLFWAYLRPNGFVQLLRVGKEGTTWIGQSEAPVGFSDSEFHALAITYDPEYNTISASLDGRTVIRPTHLGESKPEIKAVGFRINNVKGQEPGEPQVDNFKYAVTP